MIFSSFLRASVCNGPCPGAELAARLPAQFRRIKASWASLAALLLPGVLFGAGLFLLRNNPRFDWLHRIANYPWQLWMLALCGSVATIAGFGDWAYHRWAARCVVGRAERNCELLALAGGGLPLFILMTLASLSDRPLQFLLPAIVVVLFIATLICYDEFIFHRRRCRPLETVLHRVLVFGNGAAWLAWAHWCFVARSAQ
jgi:hypothetical protein